MVVGEGEEHKDEREPQGTTAAQTIATMQPQSDGASDLLMQLRVVVVLRGGVVVMRDDEGDHLPGTLAKATERVENEGNEDVALGLGRRRIPTDFYLLARANRVIHRHVGFRISRAHGDVDLDVAVDEEIGL